MSADRGRSWTPGPDRSQSRRCRHAPTRISSGVFMDMHGQRVVVVGGTSGIGLAVAQAAAGRGADVVVASARQASVDKALARLGSRASGETLAVTDADAAARFFDRVGPLDHVVYTAGEALTLMPVAEFHLERALTFFR